MPAPASVDDLLDLVVKSGVTDEARLRAYVDKLAETGTRPPDPAKMAGQLVKDGLLTYFQAEQLLQGKWKRFTIGKYKVLERLGSGGMGQVFLCEHKFMRRRVAVKVLPTAKADDPASLERFYREARAVAAVDHPNIVRAYDIDQDENLHFLVMEWVDGTNLQDLVRKTGPLDVTRACHYIYGSAVGLQHAHEVGLVHRDIKPGNILIDRSGVVKILDMGLARFFHDEDDVLTKKYDENVLGTADYLAPEQALESHTVDIRADIYSLGATFYYLLTASALFPEGTVAQKLIWHQSRSPKPIRDIRPDVPEEVVAVIAKMMAKDPADRYQTPDGVMAALAPWVSTPIPPPTDKELPTLSPAAMGRSLAPPSATTTPAGGSVAGRAGGPISATAPATLTAPSTLAGNSWEGRLPAGGLPPASGPLRDTRPSVQAPPPRPDPAPVPVNTWEALSAEMPAVTTADAPSSRRTPAAGLSSHVHSAKKKGLPVWAYLGGALGLAVVSIGVVALLSRDKTPATPTGTDARPQPAHHDPRTLYVSKAKVGQPNVFTSLGSAMSKAGAGDTIVVEDEKVNETALPSLRGPRFKGLTIRSDTGLGKPAVIDFIGGGNVLELSAVEDVTITDLVFEGAGNADACVVLSGRCPNTRLKNLTVRNFKQAGVKLLNAAGEPDRPIEVDRLRATVGAAGDTSAGVLVAVTGADITRHVAVRGGRFTGPKDKPGKSAVQFNGAVDDFEFTQNRVFELGRGVTFNKPPAGTGVAVRVTNNTFHTAKVGVLFEFNPADAAGVEYKLDVSRNFFSHVDKLARFRDENKPPGKARGIPPAVAQNNAYDKSSKEGNVSLNAVPFQDQDMDPKQDVNDEGGFLVPRGSLATALKAVGPEKVRVGYTGN